MINPPPTHQNHVHFARQYTTKNYDYIKIFPTFCERKRYHRPDVKPEPRARTRKPFFPKMRKTRHNRNTCRIKRCVKC